MSKSDFSPRPNNLLSSKDIADILLLKEFVPKKKSDDIAYLKEMSAVTGLRPEVLAFYWAKEYVPPTAVKDELALQNYEVPKKIILQAPTSLAHLFTTQENSIDDYVSKEESVEKLATFEAEVIKQNVIPYEEPDKSLAFAEKASKKLPYFRTYLLFSLRRAFVGVPLKDIPDELASARFGKFSESYIKYEFSKLQSVLRVKSLPQAYEKLIKKL